MKPLFHSSLYQFDTPQPSYWEASCPPNQLQNNSLDANDHCDVAIIGGGYTGLSAALHLSRDYQLDVRVLEAGHIGWGASGRNGGFVSMGSTKLSIEAQIKQLGLNETRRFFQSQAEAVNLVKTLGQDEDINFLSQGDREYVVADNPGLFEGLKQEAEVLQQQFGIDTEILSAEKFREQGYDSPHQHGAISLKPSFALHPLRYAFGLAEAAERRGAVLHPHSEVLRWEKQNGKHILQTANGQLTADRVILTGNGFMPEHLHPGIAGRPFPVQSAIVVTRPLNEAELSNQGWLTENPTINSKHLFYYYRLLSDKRLMIGGRANHDGNPEGAEATFKELKSAVANFWPHFAQAEFTHQWRGLVCLARNLRPSIGRMPEDPSIYFAFAYHGNGVNTSTWAGRELAKWMAGTESDDEILPTHLPAIYRGLAPRFPLPWLRCQYLRFAMKGYRIRDRLGI
ncbi:MAG: FAD-binding oxidoreductase [Pseudomonadota bacterium]